MLEKVIQGTYKHEKGAVDFGFLILGQLIVWIYGIKEVAMYALNRLYPRITN